MRFPSLIVWMKTAPREAALRTGLDRAGIRWCLGVILLAGLVLRIWGLSWGLPHPDLPRVPDHYDEFVSMRTLQQMNRHAGDWNPEEAHICGTLVFFGWYGVAEVLNAVGILEQLPCYVRGLEDPDYRRMLLFGRGMIVFADMATLFLLFVLGSRLARSPEAGLWAAAFYAILPFQVIHTHFMRPHVVGNLYVVLILILTMALTRRPLKLSPHLGVGLVLGLAMASLYQLFALAIIPYFAYLGTRIPREQPVFHSKAWAGIALNWRLFALAGVALATFFLGCPFLFLAWETAAPYIESQSNATDHSQFAGRMLFDLSKTWPYLLNALPMSLFGLTVPAYASMVYMPFRKPLRAFSVPVLVFCALYTYYATKGYGLFAARALLYLFPVFAVFSGVLLMDLRRRAVGRGTWTAAFWTAAALLFASTALYTFAYVRCMGQERLNPYRQVFHYFNSLEPGDPLRVGFIGWEWDRYHVFNMEQILRATPHEATVTGSGVDYLHPDHRVDYLLLFNFDSTMHERVDALFETLREDPAYQHVTTFSHPFRLGPVEIDLSHAPTDFRYPFPVIHLFARHEEP